MNYCDWKCGNRYRPEIRILHQQQQQQQYLCGYFIKDEGILFFQKKISYQHNMITQVFIHHIKLGYRKMFIR